MDVPPMNPELVLYAICGLVGVAAAIFVVGTLVTLLRRPQLPDLSSLELGQAALTIAPIPSLARHPAFEDRSLEVQATTPFQKAIRALTPVPWMPRLPVAPAAPAAPSKPRLDLPELPRLKAPTPNTPPPVLPREAAKPAPSLIAPAVAKSPAPAPANTPPPDPIRQLHRAAAAPAAAPAAATRSPKRQRARLPAPEVRFASWQTRYPRKGRGRRLVLATFAFLVVSSGVLVGAPHLIDPLCDDYEWFGDGAASAVRDVAVDAHDAIANLLS